MGNCVSVPATRRRRMDVPSLPVNPPAPVPIILTVPAAPEARTPAVKVPTRERNLLIAPAATTTIRDATSVESTVRFLCLLTGHEADLNAAVAYARTHTFDDRLLSSGLFVWCSACSVTNWKLDAGGYATTLALLRIILKYGGRAALKFQRRRRDEILVRALAARSAIAAEAILTVAADASPPDPNLNPPLTVAAALAPAPAPAASDRKNHVDPTRVAARAAVEADVDEPTEWELSVGSNSFNTTAVMVALRCNIWSAAPPSYSVSRDPAVLRLIRLATPEYLRRARVRKGQLWNATKTAVAYLRLPALRLLIERAPFGFPDDLIDPLQSRSLAEPYALALPLPTGANAGDRAAALQLLAQATDARSVYYSELAAVVTSALFDNLLPDVVSIINAYAAPLPYSPTLLIPTPPPAAAAAAAAV